MLEYLHLKVFGTLMSGQGEDDPYILVNKIMVITRGEYDCCHLEVGV